MQKENKLIELLNEIQQVSEEITQTHYEIDSGDQINGMITTVIGIMGRTPRIEAEAEYLLNSARGKNAEEIKKLSATVFREKLAELTANEQKVFKFAHRINTHLPEILGALRSQLSYVREQIPKQVNNDVIKKIEGLEKEIKAIKTQLEQKL